MNAAFKENLFARAKAVGFKDCEIYYRRGQAFECRVFRSAVSDYKNASFEGLAFRGTYGSKMGYAYTERITDGLIGALVDQAAANAGIIDDSDVGLYQGAQAYPAVETYYEGLNAISQEQKIEAAMAMERAALQYDARIKSVPHCVTGTAEDEVMIANSYGLTVSHRRNFALAYLYPQAEEHGRTKLAGDMWYGVRWDEFDPARLAADAARRTLSYLGAASVKSGRYRVLFSNETAADLLKIFSGVFYAENVQKGFSLLAGKLGEAVANPLLTLRDDAVCAGSLGGVPFDAEGVPARDKVIVENGVLKTLLYTMKSAAKDNAALTGNGFRNGIHGAVTTACTNLYISPSQRTRDDMLSALCDGLYITELSGLHAGANAVSGDFSLSATGFLVAGGQIKRPVEQITVAGNFYQALRDLSGVGGDLRFDMPGRMGTVGAPSILIGALDVSGS